jgi:hypothetical protein
MVNAAAEPLALIEPDKLLVAEMIRNAAHVIVSLL